MKTSPIQLSLLCLVPLLLIGAATGEFVIKTPGHTSTDSEVRSEQQVEEQSIKVQYLEIVTSTLNETCEALMQIHGVEFSEPIPELGNARTANLNDGGRIGVRAPMRETEKPVVRPYTLVEDIQAAIKAAEMAGAEVAIPPMEIPGQGTFAIYILGGIEHGLWQL